MKITLTEKEVHSARNFYANVSKELLELGNVYRDDEKFNIVDEFKKVEDISNSKITIKNQNLYVDIADNASIDIDENLVIDILDFIYSPMIINTIKMFVSVSKSLKTVAFTMMGNIETIRIRYLRNIKIGLKNKDFYKEKIYNTDDNTKDNTKNKDSYKEKIYNTDDNTDEWI